MSAGRIVHVVAIAAQTGILTTVIGRIEALSDPGQVLAVLLPLALSLAAAGLRQPIALTVGAGVAILAASAAGLSSSAILALSLALLVQFVLVEEPTSLPPARMMVGFASVATASWILVTAADNLVAPGGGPFLAVAGLAGLALAGLAWARS